MNDYLLSAFTGAQDGFLRITCVPLNDLSEFASIEEVAEDRLLDAFVSVGVSVTLADLKLRLSSFSALQITVSEIQVFQLQRLLGSPRTIH